MLKSTLIILALCSIALAQAPPQLSTADRVALQALENQKQQAQQSMMQAQQQEAIIEHEFSVAHPGWRINGQSLTVEQDEHPAPKAPVKPPAPPVPPKK